MILVAGLALLQYVCGPLVKSVMGLKGELGNMIVVLLILIV